MNRQTELVKVEPREIATWGAMASSFLDTLNTDNTRQTYGPTVYELADLWPGGPATVSAADLASWRASLLDRMEAGALAPKTVKRKLAAARSFFEFARLTGQSNVSKDVRGYVLKLPRADVQRPFQILSETEEAALLDAVTGQPHQIVAVMLYAGLRVSEVCKLRAADYYQDAKGRLWLQVRGKGGKVRQVPVCEALAGILGELRTGDGPLFPSRQRSGNGGHHYSRARLFQIVTGAIARAGVGKRISPHSLRHTFAMRWVGEVPLPVLQKWLGHADLSTTQRYVDHFEDGETHKYMQ